MGSPFDELPAGTRFGALFLGTGTSVGVPMIGCDCPVCTSSDPRDVRCRSSLCLMLDGRVLVLDTGPDFRTACLRWRVPRVDAVAITHLHADHIFGFDDVRRFNTIQHGQIIPCYAGPETIAGMRRVFPYISAEPDKTGLYRPLIVFTAVSAPFEALGAVITPLPVVHGTAETFGYRIDFAGRSLAYLPDVHEIPETTLALVEGLDVLIINLLRVRAHPTHLTLDAARNYIGRISARRTFCTHFSHDLSHAGLQEILAPVAQPAWDGCCIALDCP